MLKVEFLKKDWMFMLIYVGLKKINCMILCLVIVVFFVDNVYVIVELLCWIKGGVVVVMGVLLLCICNV